MAAATEPNARIVDYWGRTAMEIAIGITWNNGDTFVSEFASVSTADFMPTTQSSFGLTHSGKTITLVSGGSLTGDLQVFADNT